MTSPRMRTANPGPKEWLAGEDLPEHTQIAADAAASSLKRSQHASQSNFNFMRSGKPPTLWWLLMVWLGPFTLEDSMTSG